MGSARSKVTVLGTGFEYQGKSYPSLSLIAQRVTGTRWNGFHSSGFARNTANEFVTACCPVCDLYTQVNRRRAGAVVQHLAGTTGIGRSLYSQPQAGGLADGADRLQRWRVQWSESGTACPQAVAGRH